MAGLSLPGVHSNFAGRANQFMRGAVSAYGGIRPGQKTEFNPPDPTVGGAIGAGAGGAVAGYQLGSMIGAGSAAAAGTTAAGAAGTGAAAGGSSAGPWGAAVGAVVGMAAYLLS